MICQKKSFNALVLAALLIAGVIGIISINLSFSPDYLWKKDFLADFVSARAVHLHLSPYDPLPTLAARMGYDQPTFRHPNPHTPVFTLFSIPFGWFSYKTAAQLVMGTEIAALAVAVLMLFLLSDITLTAARFFTVFVISFGWGSVWENLALGQTNITLLALLATSLWALKHQRALLAGTMVGCAISLKIFFWPLLLVVAMQGKFRALLASLLTITVLYGAALAVLGFEALDLYFRTIGPTVAGYYRGYSRNMSLWSVGWKLFDGTGSPVLAGIAMPPLFKSQSLAVAAAYGMALLAAGYFARLCVKSRTLEGSFGIALGGSLLISPLCWSHYLVVMALPVAYVFRNLEMLRKQKTYFLLGFVSLVCLALPGPYLASFEKWLLQSSTLQNPLGMLLVSMIPMYGVIGTSLLCFFVSTQGTIVPIQQKDLTRPEREIF